MNRLTPGWSVHSAWDDKVPDHSAHRELVMMFSVEIKIAFVLGSWRNSGEPQASLFVNHGQASPQHLARLSRHHFRSPLALFLEPLCHIFLH